MRSIALGVGIASLLASATPLYAQAPATAGPSYINGFQLVPWGADTAKIRSVYGPPMLARISEDSGLVFIYKEQSMNKTILSLYYFDRTKGLVRGVSSVPYTGADCESAMTGTRDRIAGIYPTLKPVEERIQEDPAAPFCAAVAADKASWQIRWTDPGSGNSVTIRLDAAASRVEVMYESGAVAPARSG